MWSGEKMMIIVTLPKPMFICSIFIVLFKIKINVKWCHSVSVRGALFTCTRLLFYTSMSIFMGITPLIKPFAMLSATTSGLVFMTTTSAVCASVCMCVNGWNEVISMLNEWLSVRVSFTADQEKWHFLGICFDCAEQIQHRRCWKCWWTLSNAVNPTKTPQNLPV